jgi:hypothetical protein
VALTQLTYLHVLLHEREGSVPVQQVQGAAGQQAAAQELLQQVPEWPASLQQVEVWVESIPGSVLFQPRCWTFIPVSAPGLQISVWMELRDSTAKGWVRPFRPCPHLPGVWELQGPASPAEP